MTDVVVVDAGALRDFAREIFTRVGIPPADAAIQADVLVWANLRGVDSHGVLRIPWYVELVDKGHMEAERLVRGIPLPDGTIKRVQVVAERFGVPLPW